MELRKSFSIRGTLFFLYFSFLLIWLAVGLSPAPVEATKYEISSELSVPSISLTSDVTSLKLKHGELETPDAIVGSFSWAKNKTFLIGHASTVFKNLKNVKIGDEIIYDYTTFVVQEIKTLKKAEISMNELLEESEVETLVVMTCAGESLPGGDATHRLIVTATKKL